MSCLLRSHTKKKSILSVYIIRFVINIKKKSNLTFDLKQRLVIHFNRLDRTNRWLIWTCAYSNLPTVFTREGDVYANKKIQTTSTKKKINTSLRFSFHRNNKKKIESTKKKWADLFKETFFCIQFIFFVFFCAPMKSKITINSNELNTATHDNFFS